jgi:tRNA threonylcarbamoyladenosine biosynthesis protein TsaE
VATAPDLDIISHGAEQTRRLGAHLGAVARMGDVILLQGEFGTGKTTFTQGIARGLGLDAHYVNSPTFTLINEYRIGRKRLYHIDLYRLEDDEQIATLGLDDYFDGSGIVAIEWPDRAASWLPGERLEVRFSHLNDTKRTIRFYAKGNAYRDLVERFKKDAFGT